MKKILISFWGLAITLFLQANPLPSPSIAVSELMFDTENNWIIELKIFNGYPSMFDECDSICLSSSSEKAKLEKYTINLDIYGSGFLVVRNDSLASDLHINQLGDSIQIAFYWGDISISFHSPLVFGNYPNSKVRAPQTGESVALALDFSDGLFCIDNTPTIGTENTSEGMRGTIYGKIYDKNNQPFTSSNITFRDYNGLEISPQTDGSYSCYAYAFHNKIEKLHYDTITYRGVWINIIPLDFVMEPDNSINLDIHLLEDIVYAGNSDIIADDFSVFKIYPNPIKNKILSYEVELPIRSVNGTIEVFDVSGKKIANYSIFESRGSVNLPLNITDGMYLVKLLINNKIYNTSKMLISQ